MLSNKTAISTVFGLILLLLVFASSQLHANEDINKQNIRLTQVHQHDHQADSEGKKNDQLNQHSHDRGSTQHNHGQNKQDEHIIDKSKTSKHHQENSESKKHQHSMMEDKHDYAHMIIFHADALKLTNDQLGRLVRLHLKHEKEHKKIKEKLKESMHAFKKAKMDPSSTDEQLLSLGKDHANAFNAMVEHHIQERRAIHNVLSADQRSQLNTIKMNHSAHDTKDGEHSH